MDKIFRPHQGDTEILPVPVYYENKTWRMGSFLVWSGLLVLGIIVLLAIGGLSFPNSFLSLRNLGNIMGNFLNIGLLALIMVVIFSNGGADLSIGAVISLTGLITALLMEKGVHPLVAIVLGLGVALFIGLINGILVGMARLPGLLVTLAMMALAQGFATLLSNGLTILVNDSFFLNGVGTTLNIAGWVSLIAVGVISALWVQFPKFSKKTGLGRTDGSQTWFSRACRLGLPYLVSSIIAGLVGLRMIGYVRAAYANLGSNYEISVILAVVIGGTYFGSKFGNAIGALLGAFFLAVLNYLTAFLNISYPFYLQGLLLLIGLVAVFGYHAIVGLLYRQKHGSKSELAQTEPEGDQTAQAKMTEPAAAPSPGIPDYLVQSILCTIFCCWPLGIPAIVYAARVNKKIAAGDMDGAREASRSAKTWCGVSLGIGLVILLVYLVLILIRATAWNY